jgi:glycosyltransferase involved in cell wall biosynthesis
MGGAEVHLHEIFKRIVKHGHRVTLVAHKFSGSPHEETIDGIKIKRIGNKYSFKQQFKNYYTSSLKNNNYDIVVDDISKIPLNTPSYIKKPIVGILHHFHGKSLYKEIPFPLAYYIIKKETQIPKYYKDTPIFTVSESTKKELSLLGFNKSKIEILHNAIDHDLFSSIKEKKSNSPLLTYVGRIKKYKNIDMLIRAIPLIKKDISNIKLIIGGKGDNLQQLKNLVKKLGLENEIEFTGFLSETEKAKLMAKAWLFVTMAEKEGWGITIIEANAVNTPAIGSDVPGLRDSIRDGITGHLVPLGDINKLSQKIKSVIMKKSELEEMSNNAHEWSKNFTWDISSNLFLNKIEHWYPELK